MDYILHVIFDFFGEWLWLRANRPTRSNGFVFGCLLFVVLGLVLLVAAFLLMG